MDGIDLVLLFTSMIFVVSYPKFTYLSSLVVCKSFLLNWEQIWFAENMEECFPVFANSFYILMRKYSAFI